MERENDTRRLEIRSLRSVEKKGDVAYRTKMEIGRRIRALKKEIRNELK